MTGGIPLPTDPFTRESEYRLGTGPTIGGGSIISRPRMSTPKQ